MGRQVSDEEGYDRGAGSGGKRSKFEKHSDGGKGKGGFGISPRGGASGSGKHSRGRGDEEDRYDEVGRYSRGRDDEVDISELKTICWDCKKGKYAQKHFSRAQCRHQQGHTACDWREDPREGGGTRYKGDGRGGRRQVLMGEGGRCTKCNKVWVEEEEEGEDMRENGLLVCEDCRSEVE